MSMFATPPPTISFSSERDPTKQSAPVKVDDDDEDKEELHVNKRMRFSEPNIVNLLRTRKLFLVLDLDHTLLHSVSLIKLTAKERSLYDAADKDSLPVSVSRIDHGVYAFTKLRPFLHSFLKQASQLFEMFICTMGSRGYALQMVKLIDPDNVYFDNYSRIAARENLPFRNRKSLDVFMGKENERAVVILDDTEYAWVENKRNLIVPESYNYFAAEKDRGFSPNSHSVSGSDESESTGTLASALEVLRCILGKFFNVADQDEGLAHQDVRCVMGVMVGESNSGKPLRC